MPIYSIIRLEYIVIKKINMTPNGKLIKIVIRIHNEDIIKTEETLIDETSIIL